MWSTTCVSHVVNHLWNTCGQSLVNHMWITCETHMWNTCETHVIVPNSHVFFSHVKHMWITCVSITCVCPISHGNHMCFTCGFHMCFFHKGSLFKFWLIYKFSQKTPALSSKTFNSSSLTLADLLRTFVSILFSFNVF